MDNSINRIRACKRCKEIIHENRIREYCPTCYSKVEGVFDKIREYLYKYPGATAFEMQERLGISANIINRFVKEDRLIEIENEIKNIQCLRCKGLLLSSYHKYCPTCEEEMKAEILQATNDLQESESNKKGSAMHLKHYLRNK